MSDVPKPQTAKVEYVDDAESANRVNFVLAQVTYVAFTFQCVLFLYKQQRKRI